MAQEEVDATPQRGTLLRRAHELLESLGQPVDEKQLIQHLFGASGSAALWTQPLRQSLASSSLFEQVGVSDDVDRDSQYLASSTQQECNVRNAW